MLKQMFRPIFPNKTHVGTPVIAKIANDLNGIRRHYWEASRKEEERSRT
jgi:hypothetical protein